MTELADRLSRHADLHEHQPWADDEQMQFARDLREAVGLIAELARLRADMEFYRNFAAEVLAVKRLPIPHDMEALCRQAYENRYHKIKADMSYYNWRLVWVRAIASHEAAPPAQPAEPTIDEQVASVNAAFDAWRNGEDATLTLGLAAQPADPIAARSRYETAYAGRQLPHTQTTTSEPVQRLSDAGIEALAGKHVGNSKLTRVDVISARRLRAKGETFQSIADRFSVDIKTIMAAIKGKQWSHVIDPAAPKATK